MNAGPTKAAFITGVTGQDGANLAEFLLKKGRISQQVPPSTEEPLS